MNQKIRKILCPLDFSDVSKNALRYSLQFADIFKAEIHLLHVLEPATEVVMEVPHTIAVIDKKSIAKTREKLKILSEEVLTEVAEQLKNEPILFSAIEIGVCGSTINHEANRKSADLIIMGTRDESHKNWWLGSVASEVLANASVPILIVPENEEYRTIDRVSFATNLRRADLLHYLKLVDFLSPINPEFRYIHVKNTGTKETEISMEELLETFDHKIKDSNITFHELEEDDITEALEAFNLIYHVDLQVLVKTKRTFIQALFHRSQAKKTANYTHVPLLVIPE